MKDYLKHSKIFDKNWIKIRFFEGPFYPQNLAFGILGLTKESEEKSPIHIPFQKTQETVLTELDKNQEKRQLSDLNWFGLSVIVIRSFIFFASTTYKYPFH